MTRNQLFRPLAIGASSAAALLFANCIAVFANESEERLPDRVKVVGMEVLPTSVELNHAFDYAQLQITGRLDNGQTADLTRLAQLESETECVDVSADRMITPVSDGEQKLQFRYGDLTAEVHVRVRDLSVPYQPGFVADVQPVVSRLGCNAGTCHGSKDGKNGFKLSLRGYDSIYDYRAFTDDIAARRFNRAAPDQSLMLLKASGAIPHVGGGLTQPGERYYELIRRWIAAGVKYDGDVAPRVERLEISPTNPVLPAAGLVQQFIVTAHYTDGSQRDVTHEAFVESGNIEVLSTEEGGKVKLLRRGEAPILVRFEGAYAATTLTVMGDRSGFAWQQPEEFNYVDTHVYDKLQRVKVLPSDLCSDDEFIRRVYLDLTGLPPSADQVINFLADDRPTKVKRDELVDRLVGNGEYVEYWTNKWADLLQVNRKFLGEEGAILLRNWIKDSVASNKPYDQFAYEILTASGSTIENPPAAYYKVLRNPADIMENTTHLFLAVRFNCNKCHDHPFERWTQDQYYELAAYFARVRLKEDPAYAGRKIGGSAVEGAKPLVEVVYDTGGGEVKHERTGQNAAPSFPYPLNEELDATLDRRMQLAQWVTAPDNQYFARSLVNRLWGYLLGRGIIDPIDDIRAGNPPTNPELLDALETDFIESGFDIQHMLATICKSRTYQHSVATNPWNEDDDINFSHAIPRRLPAEVLFDAIHFASGTPINIPGAPAGFRAAQIPDAGVKLPFLDDFGKPPRESACECERSSGVVLGPIMKLVNGPTVANALSHPQNAITRLEQEIEDDRKLVEEIFLRFLARYPTEQEIELSLEAMTWAGEDLEDNSRALEAYRATIPERQARWEASLGRVIIWNAATLGDFSSLVGAEFTVNEDGSVTAGGTNGKDVYSFTTEWNGDPVTGLRLEALADSALPAGGPGRAQNGNFVISELTVTAISQADPSQTKTVKLQNATADFSQSGWPVANSIDGNPGTGWAISPQFNKSHTAIYEFAEDYRFEEGTIFKIEMSQQFQDGTHSLGRFRIAFTTAERPLQAKQPPADLATLLAVKPEERTDEQKQALTDAYLKTDAEYQRLYAAVEQSLSEKANPRLYGMQDLAWALVNNPSFLFNR